jgi:hypothetical protein
MFADIAAFFKRIQLMTLFEYVDKLGRWVLDDENRCKVIGANIADINWSIAGEAACEHQPRRFARLNTRSPGQLKVIGATMSRWDLNFSLLTTVSLASRVSRIRWVTDPRREN